MKREGIFLNGYPKSYRELQERIENFVEYYNSERPHENLNYMSPDEFEQQFTAKNQKLEKSSK